MVGKLYTIHGEKDDFQRIVALEDGIHSSDCGVLGSDNEKMVCNCSECLYFKFSTSC